MIIRSLKLHNYRRFVNCMIEFPEGIVGLIGNNGAGKSTIIEAVAWVLYGNEAARTGKDEIRRTGAPPGEECFVEMDFELDNEPYRIFRNIRGKSATSDAEFYAGKKLMAKSTRAVNTEVQKVLGLELRNFQISFFARQKELNALSDLRPAERRAHIIRLLGIDAVDEAISSLRRDKNDNTNKKILYTQTAKDITVTKDAIEEYSDKIKNSEARIEKGKEYIQRADAIRQESRAKFERISKIREEYLQLKTRGERFRTIEENYKTNLKELEQKLSSLESNNAEMEKLKTRLRDYEKVKAEKERYDKLQSDYKMSQSFKKNRNKLLSDREDLEKEIASYREVVEDYDKVIESLALYEDKLKAVKKEIEDKRNATTDIRSRIRSLADKRSELELQLNNIEELGPDSKCDRCLRPMGNDYQSIHSHLTGEIDSISASVDRLKPELKRIENELSELRTDREDMEGNRQKLLNTKANIEQQKKELAKYEKNLDIILQRIEENQKEISALGEIEYADRKHNELNREVEKLNKLRESYLQIKATIESLKDIPEKIKTTETALQETSAKLDDLRNRVKQLDYSESIYKELESEKDKHEKDYHKAQITLKELENDYNILSQKMESFKNELKRKEQLEEDIKSLEGEITILTKLDKILDDFREDLISRIKPELSVRATNYLDMLTNGKYSELEVAEGYNINIFDGGDKFELDRFSGGEQDVANLCLRLAISELAADRRDTRFQFIVLDEIFGSLDFERREAVLNALGNLRKRFRQIFVITHLEDIKDRLENVIMVEELSDGSSRARFV